MQGIAGVSGGGEASALNPDVLVLYLYNTV